MVIDRRAGVAVLSACLWSIAAPRAQTPDVYAQLKFRYIGPVGNRVIAVAGVPNNPNVTTLARHRAASSRQPTTAPIGTLRRPATPTSSRRSGNG